MTRNMSRAFPTDYLAFLKNGNELAARTGNNPISFARFASTIIDQFHKLPNLYAELGAGLWKRSGIHSQASRIVLERQ